GNSLTIRTEGNADETRLSLQHTNRRMRCCVEQQHLATRVEHLVITPHGGQQLAVGAEGDIEADLSRPALAEYFLAGSRVPEPEGAVPAAAGQAFTIRAKRNARD